MNTGIIEGFLIKVGKEQSLPVVIKKYDWEDKLRYIYPYSVLSSIQAECRVNFLSINKKQQRRQYLKELIDLHINKKITIYLFHLGLQAIYSDPYRYAREDFSEAAVGKRRFEHLSLLPKMETVSNDEFIIETWLNLSRYVKAEPWDAAYNANLSQVRLLFEANLFDHFTGVGYDADWVEPISNARDRECRTWTKEKDPMSTEESNNYLVGEIILGTDGGGIRHFIHDKPIHAGTTLEVKFGDGWIVGRYEYDFKVGGEIRIHSKNDTIYINEGHIVRIK